MKTIRLKEIANYLENSDRLADIGCDHGYLGILAIEKGITFLQLIDNKEEPLKSAIRNLKNYDFYNNQKITIAYTLSSGLNDLLPNISAITIAGMGGRLITKIFSDDLDKLKKLDKIIIQANTDLYLLRSYLSDNSLEIVDETIIYDSGKYYEIIVCRYNENSKICLLSEDEKFFGPVLLMKRSNTFLNKWKEQILKLENIKKEHSTENSSVQLKINYIKNVIKFN